MNTALIDLLATDIPVAPKIPDGFLDITQQTYREIIISRIYAYFLNAENNPAVASLFLSSLLEVIQEKRQDAFEITDHYCELEAGTGEGGKIDLVIYSGDDKKAIIIENKIFHHLNNNLEEYWASVDVEDENKIGVLLTLHRIKDERNFINITHDQWMERIIRNGLPSGLSANEYVYLNDFINNMLRLSKSKTMNEQARFFFEHTAKVLTAEETRKQAENYIITQLQIVAERIGWKLGGSKRDSREIWDGESAAYYMIFFNNLLDGSMKLDIVIEIYREAIAKEAQLKLALHKNEHYNKLYRDGWRGPYHIHFVTSKYSVTMNELNHLSDFVYAKIENEFEPVMRQLLKELNMLR